MAGAADNDPAANPPVAARPGEPAKARPAPAPAAKPEAAARPDLTQLASMALIMLGYAFATPVILAQHSPIHLLFVGFALWEAWKFNKKLPLVVTGPYRVGDSGPTGAFGHA